MTDNVFRLFGWRTSLLSQNEIFVEFIFRADIGAVDTRSPAATQAVSLRWPGTIVAAFAIVVLSAAPMYAAATRDCVAEGKTEALACLNNPGNADPNQCARDGQAKLLKCQAETGQRQQPVSKKPVNPVNLNYATWGCASDAPTCWFWGETPAGAMLCLERDTPAPKVDWSQFHAVPKCPAPLTDAYAQSAFGKVDPFKTKVASNPPAAPKPVAQPMLPPVVDPSKMDDPDLPPLSSYTDYGEWFGEFVRRRTLMDVGKPLRKATPAPSPSLPPQGRATPTRQSDLTGTPGQARMTGPGSGVQSGVSGPSPGGGAGGLLLDVESTGHTEDTGDLTDQVLRMRKNAQ